MGKLTISMAIFNSCVKLPKDKLKISTVQIEATWGWNPQNIWDRMWTAWGYEWFCWIPGLSLEGLYRLFSQHIQNQRWESRSPNPENILIWQIFEIWTRQDMYNWEPLRTRKRAFVTGLKGTEKFRTGFLAVILSGGSPVFFPRTPFWIQISCQLETGRNDQQLWFPGSKGLSDTCSRFWNFQYFMSSLDLQTLDDEGSGLPQKFRDKRWAPQV